jgi:hypothetical protein
MKKLVSLSFLALTLTGISIAQGAASQPIEGSWGLQQAQGPLTFDTTFTIQNNAVTITNVCTFEGHSATARVSAPAQYDGATLTVMGSADDNESRDGVNCNVSVKPDRMNYRVVGSRLILTHDGSLDQFVLQRR